MADDDDNEWSKYYAPEYIPTAKYLSEVLPDGKTRVCHAVLFLEEAFAVRDGADADDIGPLVLDPGRLAKAVASAKARSSAVDWDRAKEFVLGYDIRDLIQTEEDGCGDLVGIVDFWWPAQRLVEAEFSRLHPDKAFDRSSPVR